VPSTSFLCCNLRGLRSARLLGFSLFGAMLFSDHEHTVRPVIKLALYMCECVYEYILQSLINLLFKKKNFYFYFIQYEISQRVYENKVVVNLVVNDISLKMFKIKYYKSK